MTAVRRTVAGIRASTRSFRREPFTLVLLAVLPPLSIQLYGVSMGQFPDVGLFDAVGSLATTGRITGAVFATGALAGILGLFQMISARRADRRLAICGFRGVELVCARFATVLAASGAVAAVATVSLVLLVEGAVGAPLAAFVGFILAGATYGLLGILVGSVLPRKLEGSLFLVILADVDNVFASGLFGIDQSITNLAPLSHPHAIVTAAVVDGTFATAHLAPALAILSVVAALGVATYSYRTDAGGTGR
ncbi:hypothetical protein ACKVMT_07790 [Halobacteriales archaeon Cl-PHB]